MHKLVLFAVASVILLAPATVGAQGLSAYSTCASSDSLYVIWNTYEPPSPDQYPNWVGYDVLRRKPTDCGGWSSFVRVNAEMIPREAGLTHTRYFGEVPPSSETLYEYWVLPVDANHQTVFIPGFCSPCNVLQICPPFSTPITIGTLEDWGWTLAVNSCPGSCYPGAYLADQATVDELRPYVGTGTAFRFFGTIGCGTVEGCALDVDHWELTTCVTPTVTRSWGRLKTIYR